MAAANADGSYTHVFYEENPCIGFKDIILAVKMRREAQNNIRIRKFINISSTDIVRIFQLRILDYYKPV